MIKRLHQFIKNYPAFKWGRSDCVYFSADWVGVKAPHKNKKDAIQLIREAGSFEALVDQYLTRKPLAFCSRGDIAMVQGSWGKALGICVGEFVLCNDKAGIKHVRMSRAVASWEGKCLL